MILNKVLKIPAEQKARYAAEELAVFLDFTVISKDGRRYAATPGIAIKDSSLRPLPDTVKSQSLVLRFDKVDPATGKLTISVRESSAITDLITLKVYEFPMINILWIGVIVMVTGFILAIIQRVRKMNPLVKV
jgi:cytochrome c-type biogenesis protein CcmF